MGRLSKSYRADNLIAEIGVALLLGVQPLFMTNKYFNITISKFVFFVSAVTVAFFACFLFRPEKKKDGEKNEKLSFRERFRAFDKLDLSMIVFVVLGFLTFVLSDDLYASFTGCDGRFLGYGAVLAFGGCYVFISRHLIVTERVFVVFQFSVLLIMILAFVQSCGADPFGLLSVLTAADRGNFLGTVGNIDVFASLISVSAPVSIYFLTYGKIKRPLTILYSVSLIFQFFGLFISCCDSGYLGVFAGFWAVAFLAFESRKNLSRFFGTGALFFVCAVIYNIFVKSGLITREVSSLTALVTDSLLTYICLGVCTALSVIVYFVNPGKKARKISKIIFLSLTVLAGITLLGTIFYFSVIDRETALGELEQYLRFNDKWGTERGTAWRLTLTAFARLPFIQKLFGCGQDSLYVAFKTYCSGLMEKANYYADNAHNEYLQYLTTIGIFGFAAYFSICACAIKKARENHRLQKISGAVMAAIIAYMVQAVVNITQPMTTPLLFVFIALAAAQIRSDKT